MIFWLGLVLVLVPILGVTFDFLHFDNVIQTQVNGVRNRSHGHDVNSLQYFYKDILPYFQGIKLFQ